MTQSELGPDVTTNSSPVAHLASDLRLRVPQWASELLIAVLIVVVNFAPIPGEPVRIPDTLALTLTLVAIIIALTPLRRRWPHGYLVATVVLYGVSAVFTSLSPGIALAATIGVYEIVKRSQRVTGMLTAGITAVLIIGLSLLSQSEVIPGARIIQFTLAIAVGAAMGDAIRSRLAYLEAVTERAVRAEETREAEARRRVSEERLKIARDLHDTLAHEIAVISLNAGVTSSAIDTRPEKAKESLAILRRAARTVLGEIGDLLELLRADGDESSLSPQPGLEQLDGLIARFSEVGLDITVRVEGESREIGGATDSVAYRVIQEALTNAHKHGSSGRAHILISRGASELTIVVTNSVGDEVRQEDAPRPGAQLGLRGLQERVAAVRGDLKAGPATGGWKVTARLPVEQELPS